jgi:molybdopterin-synthase adenylyltransferase
VVIGVGSIGRQVAIQLAAVGLPSMTLYDPDRVSIENLAPQGFMQDDVGTPKVHAVANIAHQQFPRMELHSLVERFRKSHVSKWPVGRQIAVFCCVDSIASRKLIWESVQAKAHFFVDGRMASEVIRVVASDTPAMDRYYTSTLFSSSEAYQADCASRSTIYSASIAGGLMVAQFSRWLRRLPINRDQLVNLLSQEMLTT